MLTKKFTDWFVLNLKSDSEKPKIISESSGLALRIMPSGTKIFVLMYRFQGRSRLLTIGKYPKVSLAKGREIAATAQRKIEEGIDPGEEKIKKRTAYKEAHTVESLVQEYLDRWAKIRKKTWKEDRRCLNREVIPVIGKKKALSIKRRDLIELVENIRDGRREKGEPAPAMANRTLNVLTRLFNWALEVDIIQTSPAVGLRLPAPKRQRDRYLADDEIIIFWTELEKVSVPEAIKLALRLILATGQRRGEIAGGEWKDFNLKINIWTLPASKTKSSRAHVVPLSELTLEILKQVRNQAPDSDFIFPAQKNGGSMDPRLITRWCRKIQDQLGLPKFNPHDLRRTCATGLGALGVDRLTIGKILNHADSGVTGIYDVHEYIEQKKRAMDNWAGHLNQLINPR